MTPHFPGLVAGTSNKNGAAKLALWAQTSPLCEMLRSRNGEKKKAKQRSTHEMLTLSKV